MNNQIRLVTCQVSKSKSLFLVTEGLTMGQQKSPENQGLNCFKVVSLGIEPKS